MKKGNNDTVKCDLSKKEERDRDGGGRQTMPRINFL